MRKRLGVTAAALMQDNHLPSLHVPIGFYGLVIVTKLSADVPDKDNWHRLAPNTSKKFGAEVTGMRLAVTEGFRAPPKY